MSFCMKIHVWKTPDSETVIKHMQGLFQVFVETGKQLPLCSKTKKGPEAALFKVYAVLGLGYVGACEQGAQ